MIDRNIAGVLDEISDRLAQAISIQDLLLCSPSADLCQHQPAARAALEKLEEASQLLDEVIARSRQAESNVDLIVLPGL